MSALIETRDLGLAFGGETVLEHVTLSLAPGEIVTIVGPNGSGKSTLLKALIGVHRPSAGQVLRKPGLRLGYVPQRLAVDRTLPLSVSRFMDLGAGHDAAEKALALRWAGRSGIETRQLADLSGGELQRVLFARALLGRPEVLLLDEPTQGLDQAAQSAFYQRLEAWRDETGCAVMMVSHDLHVVMSASDRVICINGHVCCEGAPAQVSAAPEYRALFGTGTGGALALYRHEHDHHHHSHEPAA